MPTREPAAGSRRTKHRGGAAASEADSKGKHGRRRHKEQSVEGLSQRNRDRVGSIYSAKTADRQHRGKKRRKKKRGSKSKRASGAGDPNSDNKALQVRDTGEEEKHADGAATKFRIRVDIPDSLRKRDGDFVLEAKEQTASTPSTTEEKTGWTHIDIGDFAGEALASLITENVNGQESEGQLPKAQLAASHATLQKLSQTLRVLWHSCAIPQWERMMLVTQKLKFKEKYEDLVSALLFEIKHLQRFRQLTQNVEKAIEHRENVRALIHSYVAEYLPDQFRGGSFVATGLMLPDLLVTLRDASVQVVEKITEWRKVLLCPRGYEWQSQPNYLLKMQRDLKFLFTRANVRWLEHQDVQRRSQPLDASLMLYFPVATSRQVKNFLADHSGEDIGGGDQTEVTEAEGEAREAAAQAEALIATREEAEEEKRRRNVRAVKLLREENRLCQEIVDIEALTKGQPKLPTLCYDSNQGDDSDSDEESVSDDSPQRLVIGCRGVLTNTSEYVGCVVAIVGEPDKSLEDGPSVLALNDRVEANCGNQGVYYPGRLHEQNSDGNWDIAYDDGDFEENVPAELIRKLVQAEPVQRDDERQWWDGLFLTIDIHRPCRQFDSDGEYWRDPQWSPVALKVRLPLKDVLSFWDIRCVDGEIPDIMYDTRRFWFSAMERLYIQHLPPTASEDEIPQPPHVLLGEIVSRHEPGSKSSDDLKFCVGIYRHPVQCQIHVRNLQFSVQATLSEMQALVIEAGGIEKALDPAALLALNDSMYLRLVRFRRRLVGSASRGSSPKSARAPAHLKDFTQNAVNAFRIDQRTLRIVVDHLRGLETKAVSAQFSDEDSHSSSSDSKIATFAVEVAFPRMQPNFVLDPKYEYEFQLCSAGDHASVALPRGAEAYEAYDSNGQRLHHPPPPERDGPVILRRFWLQSIPSQNRLRVSARVAGGAMVEDEEQSVAASWDAAAVNVSFLEHAAASPSDIGRLQLAFADPSVPRPEPVEQSTPRDIEEDTVQLESLGEDEEEEEEELTEEEQRRRAQARKKRHKQRRDRMAARARERMQEAQEQRLQAMNSQLAATRDSDGKEETLKERKRRKLEQWMERERRRAAKEKKARIKAEAEAAKKAKAKAAAKKAPKNDNEETHALKLRQALSNRLLDLCLTDTAGVYYTDYHTQRQGVGVLISGGADPDICDDNGLSALTIATIRGRVAVVEALLSHGASLKGSHKKGMSKWSRKYGGALVLAAGMGYADVVEVLLEHATVATSTAPNARAAAPAVVNARRSIDGMTPLAAAAGQGHAAVVRLLLAAGADPLQTIGSGASPLDLASTPAIAQLLRDAGADRGSQADKLREAKQAAATGRLLTREDQAIIAAQTTNRTFAEFLAELQVTYPPSREPVRYESVPHPTTEPEPREEKDAHEVSDDQGAKNETDQHADSVAMQRLERSVLRNVVAGATSPKPQQVEPADNSEEAAKEEDERAPQYSEEDAAASIQKKFRQVTRSRQAQRARKRQIAALEAAGASPGCVFRIAEYEYEANDNEELAVKEGDVIICMGADADHVDDWYEGKKYPLERKSSGEAVDWGLVPKSYVRALTSLEYDELFIVDDPEASHFAAFFPPAEEKQDHSFLVGDQVEVNYADRGEWYPASVDNVRADGGYDVSFVDGDQEEAVPPSRIRRLAQANDATPEQVSDETAARKIQQCFRDFRGRKILRKSHFTDGKVRFIEDPQVAAMAENIEMPILEVHTKVAWAWDHDTVRPVHITRDPEKWKSQPLGLTANFPEQVMLSSHGFTVQVSDPCVVVQSVTENSPLASAGLEEGDAIVSVNGQDFKNFDEFIAIVNSECDMVWEVAKLSHIVVDDEEVQRVRNAILMRVDHEVEARSAWAAAHPEGFDGQSHGQVPKLVADKARSLDSLKGFLDLQRRATEHKQSGSNFYDPAPALHSIATAVEEAGLLPHCSRSTCGRYAQPSPEAWLSKRLEVWRQRAADKRAQGIQPAPQPSFLKLYSQIEQQLSQ